MEVGRPAGVESLEPVNFEREEPVKVYNLKPGDIAKLVNKSPKWVVKEILSGRLIGLKIGRTFRVSAEDFQDYLERSIVSPLQEEYSEEFQSAIDRQQFEADDRYCVDHGT